jgi:hypothetical protein
MRADLLQPAVGNHARMYLRGAPTTSYSPATGRAISDQLHAQPTSAPSLSRRFRVEETTMGHNDIPGRSAGGSSPTPLWTCR